ncbi:MAG: hypothetical protein IPO53_10650 [Chitinophagaceae bacterium]|nr:hypothetical protein [Chitinophagaceae bacterium]
MRDNLAKAQALLANSKGIEFFNKKDYFNAVALFQEAANKKPDDKNIQENLIKAKEQLQLQQQELETQKNGKDAVLKMQQSVQAFTQTLNKVPSTGVLDFDGQNYNTTSKGNGLDFIAANNEVPTDKIVNKSRMSLIR